MSYLNGRDVFPPNLLKEIQRYTEGTCVYIPRTKKQSRKPSGLQKRNAEIRLRYDKGCSVRLLAAEYFLSSQAIYKVLAKSKK